jgi:5'-nucleotidase
MKINEITHTKITLDPHNEKLYNSTHMTEQNNAKPVVYLDMDGVIADFFGGVERLYGVDHWKQLTSDKTKDLRQDVIDRISGTDFFAHIPKFNTADTLIEMIKKFTNGRYSILTSPLRGDTENSGYYKKVWIGKHIVKPDNIIVTGVKETYAVKNGVRNILIDDRPINIDKWQSKGGYGILYQANKHALSKVSQALEQYNQKTKSKEKVPVEDAAGVGIITKQNTTQDVKPGEIRRQAKKLKLV